MRDAQQNAGTFCFGCPEFVEYYINPLWRQTHHIGDNPAPGGIEIYGHAEDGHGFVFVVNANYWSDVVRIPLDERLGFSAHGSCEIVELHPTERLVLTPEGPTPAYGATITLDAPAQQVRVFEVRPAPETIDTPRVYGIPCVLEQTPQGYLLKTSAPQGTTHRFAVRVPANATPVSSASVRMDVPRQAKRLLAATELTLLGCNERYTLFDVTFRRSPAATELRHWSVQSGNADAGLSQNWPKGFEQTYAPSTFPLFAAARQMEASSDSAAARAKEMGALANFTGAYIDNAFSEEQETWIDFSCDQRVCGGVGSEAHSPAYSITSCQPIPACSPRDASPSTRNLSYWQGRRNNPGPSADE